jgi:hypothetical protein
MLRCGRIGAISPYYYGDVQYSKECPGAVYFIPTHKGINNLKQHDEQFDALPKNALKNLSSKENVVPSRKTTEFFEAKSSSFQQHLQDTLDHEEELMACLKDDFFPGRSNV